MRSLCAPSLCLLLSRCLALLLSALFDCVSLSACWQVHKKTPALCKLNKYCAISYEMQRKILANFCCEMRCDEPRKAGDNWAHERSEKSGRQLSTTPAENCSPFTCVCVWGKLPWPRGTRNTLLGNRRLQLHSLSAFLLTAYKGRKR